MIRAHILRAKISQARADALNRESGRIYTDVLVEHWRIYRHKGIWLSRGTAEKYNDFLDGDTILHAHSRDAAQQGFYKAIAVVHAQRKLSTPSGAHRHSVDIRFPWRRKFYRTTIWKNTGIRLKDNMLRLALARGLEAVMLKLPRNLARFRQSNFKEVRLVYDKSRRRYYWHIVIDDGQEPKGATRNGVAAIDLGEIHPIAITDGIHALIVSCRVMRAAKQYTNKRMAALRSLQSKKQKYSQRWWKIQRRINRFLAQQHNRIRDMEHKVSRAVIDWSLENGIAEMAIGNVRDIANGKRLHRKSQQKLSNWAHGRMRKYISYKAAAEGITIFDKVNEHHTSQTCPTCGHRHKPRGRIYICRECGFVGVRDIVGAANILSRHVRDELAKVSAPIPKYRKPFRRGLRSRLDTAQVARSFLREAAPVYG